jgi:hypothetical protein
MAETKRASTLLISGILCVGLLCGVAAGADVGAEAKAILEAAGTQGGLVVHVGCGDGNKLAEMELPDAPIFDGLAAAGTRLFLVTTDGKIICLGGK